MELFEMYQCDQEFRVSWGDSEYPIEHIFIEQPFTFFNFIAMVFMISGLILGYPLIITWMETGTVPRIPTAIIVMGLIVLSSICVTCGLVLDCVAKGRKEAKRLSYLIFPVTPKEDS